MRFGECERNDARVLDAMPYRPGQATRLIPVGIMEVETFNTSESSTALKRRIDSARVKNEWNWRLKIKWVRVDGG